MRQFFKQLLTVSVLAVLLIALQIFAFTEPPQPPPGGNVAAPLNTGSISQSKAGNLTLNALAITGNSLQTPNNPLLVQSGNVGIGTTSPAYPLDVVGKIHSATGGYVFPDNTVQTTAAGSGGVPAGTVVFYNGTACPVGWTELTQAQGRYIVGLNQGGDLGATIGSSLNNQENKPAGQHTHTIIWPQPPRSITAASGHLTWVSGPSWGNYPYTTNTGNGLTPGTNAPYIQLLVCQKS